MPQYFDFFLTSSLEKVFPAQRPSALAPNFVLSAFSGTEVNLQLVYFWDTFGEAAQGGGSLQLRLQDCPFAHQLYEVVSIPSVLTAYSTSDNFLISRTAKSYPDLLQPCDGAINPVKNEYRSLWISLQTGDVPAGSYTISVLVEQDGNVIFRSPATIRIAKQALAPQTLLHTQWFHADCLSDYYNVEAFSDAHFTIVENFIRSAVKDYGMNMMLTPVFTPPLDTQVGGERTTVQLVGIRCENGKYYFDFEKLARWAEICRRCGVEYLEIAHFFTQWGAKHCPKIMVEENGSLIQKFGWHSNATSVEYRAFLTQFIPALRAALSEMGYPNDKVYFHISDEPTEENLIHYKAAIEQVEDLLADAHVIDALSSYQFYADGLVKEPVVANDHIQTFLDQNVDNLWVYYCCAQDKLVPNRFFAMPSQRQRIMGILLYLTEVKGFLHWGYNFYNSQYSLQHIDPFAVSDAGGAFPSGDSYLVYPGADGHPLPSIRGKVLAESLQDMRACATLEKYKGKEYVHRLLCNLAGMDTLTYTKYPRTAEFLLACREVLADELEKL